ncbi:MAG: hypothetical protein NVS2B17_21450 [Candidatus Velthaea sp.]
MAKLWLTTYADVERLAGVMTRRLRAASTLQDAAQRFTSSLKEHFPSIVLAQVFATIEYSQLPEFEQRTARDAAGNVPLSSRTDVLTLLGSAGTQAHTHLAVPLLARPDGASMPCGLVNDLRLQLLSRTDAKGAPLVSRAFANVNGLVFVPDAGSALTDVELVSKHNIRSVLCFGGTYIVKPMFFATILYTQEPIAEETAKHFVLLSSTFKGATANLASRGKLFPEDRAVSSSA